jgi:hypothetical protein
MSQQSPKTRRIKKLTRVIPVQKIEFLKKQSGDRVDLPWMRNATFAPHTDIAIATAIRFLSQMASLRIRHHV